MRPTCLKKQGRRPVCLMVLLGNMVILSLLLAACGATTTPASNSIPLSSPNNLITPGILTVGSDTTYPPQEYIDPTTNTATGFDVDLISAMAKLMGLKAKIVPTTFAPLIDDLVAKRFDVVISAVTITPQRQQKVSFVPYFMAGQSLLVRKGNPKHITSTDNVCGLSVGVQDGTLEQGVLQSSSDNCLEQDLPAIKIIALPDQTAVIKLLEANRVVATYQDSSVTDYYSTQQSSQFEVGSSVFGAGPEGVVVRKDDASMLQAIQTTYKQLKATGTYHQLILKWGLTNEELATVDRHLHSPYV